MQQVQRPEFCELMAGNRVLTAQGSKAAAHCYCGYQFGSFAGQLGDGAGSFAKGGECSSVCFTQRQRVHPAAQHASGKEESKY
jgi:uncharacterized protein YdiU (UPF0061 family)